MHGELEREVNDTILRKYERDREHELELNKFSHVFELERLKLLQWLNGGGFVALTAVAGSDLGGSLPLLFVGFAVGAWLIGLWLAFQATQTALDTQVSFARAYHNRRRATEWRLLSRSFSSEDLARMVAPPPGCPGCERGDRAFDSKAGEHIQEGAGQGKQVRALAKRSVGAFIAGGVLILVGLLWEPALDLVQ